MKYKLFALVVLCGFYSSIHSMDPIPRPESPALFKDFIQMARSATNVRCKQCSVTLDTDLLMDHYKDTHGIATRYKYQCAICKLSIIQSETGKHMQTIHDRAPLAQLKYTRYLAAVDNN